MPEDHANSENQAPGGECVATWIEYLPKTHKTPLGADVVSLLWQKEHTAQCPSAPALPASGGRGNLNVQVTYLLARLF